MTKPYSVKVKHTKKGSASGSLFINRIGRGRRIPLAGGHRIAPSYLWPLLERAKLQLGPWLRSIVPGLDHGESDVKPHLVIVERAKLQSYKLSPTSQPGIHITSRQWGNLANIKAKANKTNEHSYKQSPMRRVLTTSIAIKTQQAITFNYTIGCLLRLALYIL